ncbi:hypothetical protein CapIbe_021658 [Capra ibex]
MGSTLVLPVVLIFKLGRADDQASWPGGAIGSAPQRGRPLAGVAEPVLYQDLRKISLVFPQKRWTFTIKRIPNTWQLFCT